MSQPPYFDINGVPTPEMSAKYGPHLVQVGAQIQISETLAEGVVPSYVVPDVFSAVVSVDVGSGLVTGTGRGGAIVRIVDTANSNLIVKRVVFAVFP